jgi:hypothetical protein
MAVLAFLFCVAAFGPSIVHSERRLGPTTPLPSAHGIAFFAWLLLFIAQTTLVRTGNLALHRCIGMWSAILAAALVVLGYQTTIAMGRRGYDLSGDVGILSDPLAGMAFPLLDIFMFAALFLAAYLYRHRSAIHKRLMLLAVTGAFRAASRTGYGETYVEPVARLQRARYRIALELSRLNYRIRCERRKAEKA